MIKVALILSSKPQQSESFIKELIVGLSKSSKIELKVFVPFDFFKWYGLYTILMLFKSLFFINRIFMSIKHKVKFKNIKHIIAIKQTFFQINILTS